MAASVRSGDDILLVGDQWTLNVFADAFIQRGVSPRILTFKSQITNHPTVSSVSIGNGDPKDRVSKTMGADLADYLWNLSSANYHRAEDFFRRHAVATYEKGFYRREGAAVVEEGKAVSFNPEAVRALIKSHDLVEMKSKIAFAPITILLSDLFATQQYDFLRDKIIPVTLATFGYRVLSSCPDFSMSVHNQGADFAVRFNSEVHLGSYRNLYEDKAVGVQTVADPISQKATAKFFGDLNWIDSTETPRIGLSVESFSCDGLPVVGTLPEAPAVFVIGGFSARTPNFIFEVAHQLVEGVLTDGKMRGLEPLSLKRLN